MDDRPVTVARVTRWSVLRLCESSRHHRQLLAQAYQQVFPQARQSLQSINVAVAGSCAGSATPIQRPPAWPEEREHVAV
jgi:hypothetical protein